MKIQITYKSFIERIIHEKKWTLATLITLARIVCIPFFIAAMFYHYWLVAFLIFSVASISDALDGNLARSRNEQTLLGACLDPVADKLLIMGGFGAFSYIQNPFFYVPHWFFWMIVIKELAIMLGFLLFYNVNGVFAVRPTLLAKINTLLKLLFVFLIFIYGYFVEPYSVFLYYILYILAALMLVIVLHYSFIAYRIFKK